MLYARLYRFSYLILQSVGEMGLIVPTLQIRERIAQDSTVREVAGSDCKIHGSPPPLSRDLPAMGKGGIEGEGLQEQEGEAQGLQCLPWHLDGAEGSASRTHLGLQPTSGKQAACFMQQFMVRKGRG